MKVIIFDQKNHNKEIYTKVFYFYTEYQHNNGKSHWVHLFFEKDSEMSKINPEGDLYVGYDPKNESILIFEDK